MSTVRQYIPDYSVDDYQKWKGDWELWSGVPVAMTPSPFGPHSNMTVNIAAALKSAVDAANCNATVLVEIDWIVSNNTVLRPDLLVICGPVPPRHVEQTPALVVEVLSDATRQRDLEYKRVIYQEQTVPYYFIFDPRDDQLTALKLDESGRYVVMDSSPVLKMQICDECSLQIDVQTFFR